MEFDDLRPIRVLVFPRRPDVILIYVPEGQDLWLPRLRSPFQRNVVAKKLGDVDLPARVSESVLGRFTDAAERALGKLQEERARRQRTEEAVRVAGVIADPKTSDFERERACLIAEKYEIEAHLQQLKKDIKTAKWQERQTAGTMSADLKPDLRPEGCVKELQDQFVTCQTRLLAITQRLRDIKKEAHAARLASDRTDPNHRFIEIAKRYLSREEFLAIWAEVNGQSVQDLQGQKQQERTPDGRPTDMRGNS